MNRERACCPARYENGGLFKTEEEWIHPTRVIGSYEMILALAGEIHIFQEAMHYTLRAGDVLVLRPGVQHGGTRESRGETSFYWIHFEVSQEEAAHLPLRPRTLEDAARLHVLCRQLLHVANAPDYPAYAPQAAFTLLYCELVRLCRTGDAGSRLVEETAEWVRIHSAQKLDVEGVARRSGYHPDYLSACFRASYGMGLKQYIVKERMQCIRQLLLTTGEPLKTLAGKLEFRDAEQLIHYFRYHEGISPAQYRNLYHHTHLNRA